MEVKFFILLKVLECLLDVASAANILAIIPFRVDSHFPMFENLLKALAVRGHQVVVVSHYPQKYPVENYTDISLLGSLPSTKDNVSLSHLESINSGLFATFFLGFATKSCESVYKHPNAKKLTNLEGEFDLVINEIWGNDCFLGLTHKLRAPHIGVITSVAYPWSNDRVANPDNPSYVPNFFLPYNQIMSFSQRLVNSVFTLGARYLHYFVSEIPTHRIASENLREAIPPLHEIAKNTSLIFVNSHFSIHQPRPTVPSFIEVAGLHIKEAKPLPQDISRYINESEDGVIYFSFGTMVRPDSMKPERMGIFLEVFSEIRQRVLWKCDPEKMPTLPKNVQCYPWLPQRDVLEHPNVRVFITHGGMMGTQEAVHTGTPMLGFPLFADQILNIENYVSKNIAIKLDFGKFRKEDLQMALDKLLNDERYMKNARRLSVLFRDRPQTPLETAVYWTEYVIKYRGASHLQSTALDLYWYQYLLLDVIFVLIIAAVVICWCVYTVARNSIRFLIIRKQTSQKTKLE